MQDFLIIGGILLIAILIVAQILLNRDKKKFLRLFNESEASQYKYKWVSLDLTSSKPFSAIAVDNINKSVVLIQDKTYKYSFDDIRDVEIIVDESEAINKSTLNTLGRAAVGGLLLGGIGALAGAVSGKSKIDNKIKKLDLKIKIKDLDTSIHTLTFFDSSNVLGGQGGVKSDNPIYQKAAKSLEEWFERFKAITELT